MPALLPITYTIGAWAANWQDADGTQWWVSSVSGWSDSPPARTRRSPRPGTDGAFGSGTVFRDARVVEITGDAICPDAVTAERARDRLLGLFTAGGTDLLVVAERDLTRQCTVELDAAPQVRPVTDRTFEWRLRVAAADPRRYATAVTSAACGLLSAPGGLSFPLSFPLSFGSAPTNRLTLTNSGTAESWPTWTVRGPVTDPTVVEVASGRRLRWKGTLSASETLTIDTGQLTAVLSSGGNQRGSMDLADWFPVDAASSVTVAFTASSTYDPAALLTGTFREAWW